MECSCCWDPLKRYPKLRGLEIFPFFNPYFKLPNLSVLKVADPFVEKFQQKLSCIVHAGLLNLLDQ